MIPEDGSLRSWEKAWGAFVKAWRAAAVTRPPKVTEGTPLRAYRRPRGVKTDQILVHESTTSSRESTVRVLRRRNKPKGLGVHFMIDDEGGITRHVPISKATVHAIGHNSRSIAIEVIHNYYGSRAKPGDRVIDAVWADRGKDGKKHYIVPPLPQMESLWRLVCWLCQDPRDDLPLTFPQAQTIKSGPCFKWGRSKNHKLPGVLSHSASGHSDGAFPVHFCLLRRLGLSSQDAYDGTIKAAKAATRKNRWTQLPDHDSGVS